MTTMHLWLDCHLNKTNSFMHTKWWRASVVNRGMAINCNILLFWKKRCLNLVKILQIDYETFTLKMKLFFFLLVPCLIIFLVSYYFWNKFLVVLTRDGTGLTGLPATGRSKTLANCLSVPVSSRDRDIWHSQLSTSVHYTSFMRLYEQENK